MLVAYQANAAILQERGGPLQDGHLPCPARVSKRLIAQPLRFDKGSPMDGSSMRVQENSQHQCRLHCAMHYCGYAKRPHRLVPRACPGQPEGALGGDLGARSPENKISRYAPLNFFVTFRARPASVPGTLRPLRAKTQKNATPEEVGGQSIKRNRLAPQFHPRSDRVAV